MNNNRPKPKPPMRPPLQLKRATSRTFNRVNPLLLRGEPAYEWDTHKLKIGDGTRRYRELPYIGDHSKPKNGKSAYEIWRDAGHRGTVEDFLESLVGPDGKSAYEIWLSLGNEGTIVDFIVSLEGKSAYEVWIDAGHEGSVIDFLDSLIGKSAYEIWLDLGNEGTEQDFIDSLKGESAYQAWLNTGHEGTEEDFVAFMQTASWSSFEDELDDVEMP